MQPYCSHHPRALPQPSTHRVALARRRRSELLTLLGGKCIDCGSTSELEFDHLAPRTWIANKLSRWQRMKRYLEDYAAGKLCIRCRKCNAAKGEPIQDDFSTTTSTNPF